MTGVSPILSPLKDIQQTAFLPAVQLTGRERYRYEHAIQQRPHRKEERREDSISGKRSPSPVVKTLAAHNVVEPAGTLPLHLAERHEGPIIVRRYFRAPPSHRHSPAPAKSPPRALDSPNLAVINLTYDSSLLPLQRLRLRLLPLRKHRLKVPKLHMEDGNKPREERDESMEKRQSMTTAQSPFLSPKAQRRIVFSKIANEEL